MRKGSRLPAGPFLKLGEGAWQGLRQGLDVAQAHNGR